MNTRDNDLILDKLFLPCQNKKKKPELTSKSKIKQHRRMDKQTTGELSQSRSGRGSLLFMHGGTVGRGGRADA
jgi:hypothetical protein